MLTTRATVEERAAALELGRAAHRAALERGWRFLYAPDPSMHVLATLAELVAGRVLRRSRIADGRGDLDGGIEVRATRRAGAGLPLYPTVDRGAKLRRPYLLVWIRRDVFVTLVGWGIGAQLLAGARLLKPYTDRPAFLAYTDVRALRDPLELRKDTPR